MPWAYHPEGYFGPARAGRHVVANMTLVQPPICLAAYHPEGYFGPRERLVKVQWTFTVNSLRQQELAGRHVVTNMTLVL